MKTGDTVTVDGEATGTVVRVYGRRRTVVEVRVGRELWTVTVDRVARG